MTSTLHHTVAQPAHPSMRHASQSLIAALRAAVNAWRQREAWSRETVVQQIVEAHERIGAPTATGIVFDPATRDPFERMKVNADRVYRWLDDVSKDSNLMPTNFLPSLIAALPLDLRLGVVDAVLADSGLYATVVVQANNAVAPFQYLRPMLKEFSEAAASIGDLAEHERDPESLAHAEKELAELESVIGAVRAAIQTARHPGNASASVGSLGKV